MRATTFSTVSLMLAMACSGDPESSDEPSRMQQEGAAAGGDASSEQPDAASEVVPPATTDDAASPTGRVAPCDTAGVMALLGVGDSLLDCGILAHSASMEEQTAAKKCMDDAVASEKPFRLTFTTRGADSYLTTTLVGSAGAGAYTVHLINDGPGQWDRTQWGSCKAPPAAGCAGSLSDCATCEGVMDCSCNPRATDAVDYECKALE